MKINTAEGTEETIKTNFAEHAIAHQMAGIVNAGCEKCRFRWFPKEMHIQLFREFCNRWEPVPDSDYRGVEALSIAAVLKSVPGKQCAHVAMSVERWPHHVDFVLRLDSAARQMQGEHVEDFLFGQLFWD